MRLKMKETGISPRSRWKVCPQCREFTEKFDRNVFTQDGLNICCDACYTLATKQHFAGEPVEVTEETKEQFRLFVEFQGGK